MNRLERCSVAITLISPLQALPIASAAAPATSYEVKPSAIVIYANNPEDRAYDCSIWYVWSHEVYRTTRSETVSDIAHVAPKWNGVVYSQTVPYLYIQIEEGPRIECK